MFKDWQGAWRTRPGENSNQDCSRMRKLVEWEWYHSWNSWDKAWAPPLGHSRFKVSRGSIQLVEALLQVCQSLYYHNEREKHLISQLLYRKWVSSHQNYRHFPGGLVVKNPPCNAGDAVSIPGWELRPHMPEATKLHLANPVHSEQQRSFVTQWRSCLPQLRPDAAK